MHHALERLNIVEFNMLIKSSDQWLFFRCN